MRSVRWKDNDEAMRVLSFYLMLQVVPKCLDNGKKNIIPIRIRLVCVLFPFVAYTAVCVYDVERNHGNCDLIILGRSTLD